MLTEFCEENQLEVDDSDNGNEDEQQEETLKWPMKSEVHQAIETLSCYSLLLLREPRFDGKQAILKYDSLLRIFPPLFRNPTILNFFPFSLGLQNSGVWLYLENNLVAMVHLIPSMFWYTVQPLPRADRTKLSSDVGLSEIPVLYLIVLNFRL